MKIPLPKKISVRMVTTLVLAVVILIELYLAYFSLYSKLAAQPEVAVTATIIRINRGSLNEVIKYLDGLDAFTPASLILLNPNPFNYSP